MQNILENGMYVQDLDIATREHETHSAEFLLKNFISNYGTVAPFKSFLHELFVNYVASETMDGTDNKSRSELVLNYRFLFYFLTNIENYEITLKK